MIPQWITTSMESSHNPTFSLIYTVKTEPLFWECCTCFGYETKTGIVRILLDLCSATSIESCCRDLNAMDEHRPILKNNQNTYHPILVSHPKQIAFIKTEFCFYCFFFINHLCLDVLPSYLKQGWDCLKQGLVFTVRALADHVWYDMSMWKTTHISVILVFNMHKTRYDFPKPHFY